MPESNCREREEQDPSKRSPDRAHELHNADSRRNDEQDTDHALGRPEDHSFTGFFERSFIVEYNAQYNTRADRCCRKYDADNKTGCHSLRIPGSIKPRKISARELNGLSKR